MNILNNIRLDRANVITDGDTIRVSGRACHFGTANHNGEIVTEESFADFFNELSNGGQMPIFNYQHDALHIIGGWDKVYSDAEGLLVEGHLTKTAFVRDEIIPLMESGDVFSLSTEGWGSDITVNEDNTYNVGKFLLTGISLVALPADFGANVSTNALLLERRAKENAIRKNKRKLIY